MKPGTLFCASLLALAGCSSGEHEDIKGWMKEESKDFKGRIAPLPQIQAFPAVNYEAEKLVVPFSNLKIVTSEAATDKTAPDRDRQRQPLENYPLEDLRVTGVIIDGKTPWAMIQPPPPNKPKHVTVGEFMGQNFGKITEIRVRKGVTEMDKEGVTVIELVKDTNGAWTERKQVLELKRGGR